MTSRKLMATVVGTLVGLAVWPAAAVAQPFELAVKKDQFFGSSRGTLTFSADGIEYRTDDRDDARQWTFEDIKQVQVLSPTAIHIKTYEDQGKLRLGADRTFEFEITQGAVPPALVEFLLARIDRPVVTAVVPPSDDEPLFRVPVKHLRAGQGSHGDLFVYDDRVVYLTGREGASRYWRFSDIYVVLQTDPYRLQVLAYEGGGGKTRPFTFDVKTVLPPGFFEAIWQRMSEPAAARQPLRQ